MNSLETSPYPIDIAKSLCERWETRELPSAALPDHKVLVTLLDTMY